MAGYTDYWTNHTSRATCEVRETSRQCRITWSNPAGKTFRAIVRQKPNAIGFHARLPGDR